MDGTATITNLNEVQQRRMFENFMGHLADADRMLEALQSDAMVHGGFGAIRDPRNPIHHLDEVMLAISDARSAMIAFMDGQPVR